MMMSSGAEDSLSSAEEMKAAKANSEVIPNGGENGKHANQEENIQEEEDDEVQVIEGGNKGHTKRNLFSTPFPPPFVADQRR